METSAATVAPTDSAGDHADAHAEGHASDMLYVQVAVGLGALTAIEVILSYVHALKGLYLVVPLLVVMAIKFFIVASFFMHLRFDRKILTRVFYAGLFLAAGVYVVALSTFHFFRY